MSDEVPEQVGRRSRVINATPAEIFDLLADSSPERLSEGARFGMNMRWGVPYRMTNEVVEFDDA